MALSSGVRLGPYEIVEPLGAGGMGEVYRAIDRRLNRAVAIKMVAERHRDRPDLHQRFKVEMAAIAALNHPHICQLYDVGEHEGAGYLVMELVEGRRWRPASCAGVCRSIRRCASGARSPPRSTWRIAAASCIAT